MKKYTLCLLSCVLAAGCTNSPRPVEPNAATTNSRPTNERSQTAIAHSSENQTPPPAVTGNPNAKWSASGDAIDTKQLDSAIMSAEKVMADKPTEPEAKKGLGAAFYKRAVALTEARQYASALGDYRKTLKYDPTNADAKEWIEKITMIYGSLNKQAPREGEEPPPLPFPAKS